VVAEESFSVTILWGVKSFQLGTRNCIQSMILYSLSILFARLAFVFKVLNASTLHLLDNFPSQQKII
jgi:hypothetical protein